MSSPRRLLIGLLLSWLTVVSCAPDDPEVAQSPAATCFAMGWRDCSGEPYPYSTPIPPVEPTEIDGVYERHIDVDLAWAPGDCRRCPPYRLEPGMETLRFDSGRYFVIHRGGGFRSSGHFFIDGDEITLINDPNCIRDEGTYNWSVEGGALRLDAIDDPCPFTQLRERFLTARDWMVVD